MANFGKENSEAEPVVDVKDFVPKVIFELLKNPDNLVIETLYDYDNSIRVIIYEKDYPEELTSESTWQSWQTAKKYRKKGERLNPENWPGLNRLHEALRDLIETGELKLTDRVLLYFDIALAKSDRETLHIYNVDGEKNHGIVTEFYTVTLPALAKKLGFRFITGFHLENNIKFFIDKLGGVRIDRIKEEYRDKFFFDHTDPDSQKLMVVQFIYPEDKEKYLIDPQLDHSK